MKIFILLKYKFDNYKKSYNYFKFIGGSRKLSNLTLRIIVLYYHFMLL